jgi:3-methyladenine DNA glycosylase AlkD
MHTANPRLTHLHEQRDDRYKETVVRLGIPRENSLGVSIKVLRQLAKQITPDNDLAHDLWQTGYHEARLLSVLIADSYTVDPAWAIGLMDDVVSWDLCDHLCSNLLFHLPEYRDLILNWQHDERLYHKRAAFSLIASSVIHEKDITLEQVEQYLAVIEQHKSDSRAHVKKAVSWALREIGKNDITYHPRALAVAKVLAESDDKNRRWVGKDALREIEHLVPVKGRKRLVSRKTKSGGK